ncbi:DinB family protein [Parapedobacter koreensis]|uniref:DinB superfamily protein n=1 Tax=Parapedobacter koreensis TaxID=332977 RepID=A0A1H7JDN7_9SPHI|nr:DinB family protein [Parapedobacter koreensis]SEK72761.1 DinB superfamily protein [Parapedobacter koreensis]
METGQQPEVWMRGPIPGVPPLLQPVAHALLQAKEEMGRYMAGFDDSHLWVMPADVASVGFHLQHITGVIDRMFTYAADKPLSKLQFEYLQSEGKALPGITAEDLVSAFGKQVDIAIARLQKMGEKDLTDTRHLGRKRIPTTLIGLLFHAAEHTQRHVGQLLVTVKLLPLLQNR